MDQRDQESSEVLRDVLEHMFQAIGDYSRCTHCLTYLPKVELDGNGECWRCGYVRLGESQD